MKHLLLLLCALVFLVACVSEEELKQQLQEQAEQKIAEETNQAKQGLIESAQQTLTDWSTGIKQWWDGIWGGSPAAPPAPNPEPEQVANTTAYTIGSSRARGRQCPQLDCDTIVTFTAGQAITVIGRAQGDAVDGNTDWLEVRYQDSSVFVHSSLATPRSAEPVIVDSTQETLRLPFAGTINYTGGPHDSDNTSICASLPVSSADGIDFSASSSESFEVLSIASGVLVEATVWDEKTTGRGTFVKIRHPSGVISEYWHLARLSPEIEKLKQNGKDQPVPQGFPLGFAGKTGFQKSVHLHLLLSSGWHGQTIDRYRIWMHMLPGQPQQGFNYQGSATQSQAHAQTLTLSAPACNQQQASAMVQEGFEGTTERNGAPQATLFAEDRAAFPRAPMESSNQRTVP